MAFRTNKVPAIEERSVSGSSVSFNSAFALPLKACKVSFMATESGTGEKSPSNPYTISGVSGLNLSANSVSVSVNFGNTRYGGYADLIRKKLVVTRRLFQPTTSDNIVGEIRNTHNCWCFTITTPPPIYKANGDAISNINIVSRYADTSNSGFCTIGNTKPIFALSDSDTGLSASSSRSEVYEAFMTFISTYSPKCVYELTTPIEIDLSSIPDLSSIIGNNTFSTDTGTLEITFADLQEKSASGSVASFNTALAMPLVNGEFTIQAYQEGSGDPSHDNVRNIVGYNALNMYKSADNLFDPSYIIENGFIDVNGDFRQAGGAFGAWNTTDFIEVSGDTTYLFNPNSTGGNSAKHAFYNSTKGFISSINSGKQIFTTPSNARYMRFSFRATSEDIQLIEPEEVKTKQLGEEVFGGYYRSDTGDKKKTHKEIIYNGSENWLQNTQGYFYVSRPSDSKIGTITSLCNMFKNYASASVLLNKGFYIDNNNIVFRDDGISLNSFKILISNTNLQVVYELAEPIESNIGATPISTSIGDNNIFADTGDVDLTYKDLDIAKRGNFREVFKLPS